LSIVWDARGQRPFFVYAPVQTDKTAASIREALGELRGIAGPEPITGDELARAKDQATLTLPGRWETGGAVLGDIGELVEYGLPMDYWSGYPDRVRSVSVGQAEAAARDVVRPGHMIWIVVGDLSKIEDSIRKLDLGEVHRLDMDGGASDASASPAGSP